MRTRRSNYPNNSNVTIPRRRRKQVSNIVEPEIRTIVEMAERTMEELLRAPTEGYGEAIVLPEINADHFEIKTNLLQLVQANPFYGRENENPHAHINSFKRITSTLRFRNVPNDVIKLMMFPYSLEGAAKTCLNENEQDYLNAAAGGNLLSKMTREALNINENKSKVRYSRNRSNASRMNATSMEQETEETKDKEQTNFQGSISQILPPVIPISILEPDVPKTLPKTTPIPESDVPKSLPKPNIPYPSRHALLLMPRFATTIKSLLMNKEKLLELAKIPLNENCSAMLLKKLPEKLGDPGKFLIPYQTTRYFSTNDKLVNRIDIIAAVCEEYASEFLGFSNSLSDNPTPTSEPFTSEFILEEIEAYLKDDFDCHRIDHGRLVDPEKIFVDQPPELELKDLPSYLEYAFLEENDKLPVIIAKGLKNNEKYALLKVLKSHKRAIA
ncbi:hypothetical protein Tco_0079849 [Tanacetum coccineum]